MHLKHLAWLLFMVVALVPSAVAGTGNLSYPSSMAALGNSFTLAHATPGETLNSWVTGTNPRVDSHYLRILRSNAAIKGHAFNLAEFGASFDQMQGQARKALAKHVEYVTISGGEEWCGADDLSTLGRDFGTLLRILARGKPQPRVFVASTRNPATLLHSLQAHRALVLKSNPHGAPIFCHLIIGTNAQHDTPSDQVATAEASMKRINAELARICAQFPRCRFDDNAVFHMPIAYADLSGDYDHPSIAGQRKLAQVTWNATFPFGR